MVAAAAAGAVARAGAGAGARAGAAGRAGGRVRKGDPVAPTSTAPRGAGDKAPSKATGGRTGKSGGGRTGGSSGASEGLLAGSALGKASNKVRDELLPASHARRTLVAEFILCLTVVAFSPLTDKHKDDAPGAVMKRFTAVMGLFFLLSLIASGGRGASRIAAGFGGLVTLALLLSNRNIFVVIARKMGTTSDEAPELGPGIDPDNPVTDLPMPPNPPSHSDPGAAVRTLGRLR